MAELFTVVRKTEVHDYIFQLSSVDASPGSSAILDTIRSFCHLQIASHSQALGYKSRVIDNLWASAKRNLNANADEIFQRVVAGNFLAIFEVCFGLLCFSVSTDSIARV
jgi:hypothetical protein